MSAIPAPSTAGQIKAFAADFDPQPFHLDAAAADASFFKGLAASGWHTAAITMSLLVKSGMPIAGGLIGAGGEIEWPRPVRPGDVLQVESEVLAVTPSRSRPERGMITVKSDHDQPEWREGADPHQPDAGVETAAASIIVMAHRSVGHPVWTAIILKLKRRRHLDGPHLRAMTMRADAYSARAAPLSALCRMRESSRSSSRSMRRRASSLISPW